MRTAEEDKLRYSEAVDKVIETGGIRMIIGEILCLFSYIDFPISLLPLELLIQTQIDFEVTSIGVDLKIITTDLDSGYWKVKFSEASWKNIYLGGRIRKSPGQRCEWEISIHH